MGKKLCAPLFRVPITDIFLAKRRKKRDALGDNKDVIKVRLEPKPKENELANPNENLISSTSDTFDNKVYEYGDEFNFYTGEAQRDYADYAPGGSGQDLGKKHASIQG